MSRVIVFRFHKSLGVCRDRLRLLRLFNPDVRIVGLYGGALGEAQVEKRLSPWVEHVHRLPERGGDWSWRHGDLALLSWFKARGRSIDFDTAVLVEWDLLLLDSLDRLYGHLPAGSVGLSGLRGVASVEGRWHWVTLESHREEWRRLLAHARERHGYDGEPQACIAAGAAIPRAFLDALSRIEIPELGNDELRLPLYAQILGFPLADTRLYDPRDPERKRYFTLGGGDIPVPVIRGEMGRRGGRRVFHPFRKYLTQLGGNGTWYNVWYDAVKSLRRILRRSSGPPAGGRR